MYSPDNEYSLNLFTDYRLQDTPANPNYIIEGGSTDPTMMDASGWYPPPPAGVPEPNRVSFIVSGVSPFDKITVMPYNDH